MRGRRRKKARYMYKAIETSAAIVQSGLNDDECATNIRQSTTTTALSVARARVQAVLHKKWIKVLRALVFSSLETVGFRGGLI